MTRIERIIANENNDLFAAIGKIRVIRVLSDPFMT